MLYFHRGEMLSSGDCLAPLPFWERSLGSERSMLSWKVCGNCRWHYLLPSQYWEHLLFCDDGTCWGLSDGQWKCSDYGRNPPSVLTEAASTDQNVLPTNTRYNVASALSHDVCLASMTLPQLHHRKAVLTELHFHSLNQFWGLVHILERRKTTTKNKDTE